MEAIKDIIERGLELTAFFVECIAALILIVGAVLFIVSTLRARFGASERLSAAFARARVHLGAYILAGLEFLIVADILFTIVNRTLNDVIVLAIVASVRTLISAFLEREMKELRKEDA